MTPLELLSRVEALERRMDEVLQELRGVIGRLASTQPPPEIVQAKAIAGVDDEGDPETFPITGNTFNFQLQHRKYDPAPGNNNTTDQARTEDQSVVARTLDGRFLIEGEPYPLVHLGQPLGTVGDKGEWWVIDQPRIEVVEVASLVKEGDFYPGTLLRVEDDGTITSAGGVWILDLNDQ